MLLTPKALQAEPFGHPDGRSLQEGERSRKDTNDPAKLFVMDFSQAVIHLLNLTVDTYNVSMSY